MRREVIAVAWLAACAGQPSPKPAEALPWLVGTWARIEGQARIEERWVASPSGDLQGFGRVTIQSDQGSFLGFAESLSITRAPEGLVYLAWPAGQEPTAFPLRAEGDQTVSFENPTHDFPKKIRYARQPDGTLFVEATGVEKGQEKTESWTLTAAPL